MSIFLNFAYPLCPSHVPLGVHVPQVENRCPKPQGISYLERETEEQAGRWVGGPQKDRLKVRLQTERYRGETERQIKG